MSAWCHLQSPCLEGSGDPRIAPEVGRRKPSGRTSSCGSFRFAREAPPRSLSWKERVGVRCGPSPKRSRTSPCPSPEGEGTRGLLQRWSGESLPGERRDTRHSGSLVKHHRAPSPSREGTRGFLQKSGDESLPGERGKTPSRFGRDTRQGPLYEERERVAGAAPKPSTGSDLSSL